MNTKQKFILFLGVIGVVGIAFFTPRYKITQIDEKNFLITEQTSPLFKRSNGEVKFHVDKILLYSSLWILTDGILLLVYSGSCGDQRFCATSRRRGILASISPWF